MESIEGDASAAAAAPQESEQPLSRREIMAAKAEQSRRNKPFIIAGIFIVIGLAAIPAYAFINEFVLPPRRTAVRVESTKYSSGDVVNFIRFHQRLSEESGQEFVVGSSLFDAMQTISENEMAFQGAPALGVSVSEDEIDQEIRRLLGYGYATPANITDELRGQIAEAQFQFLNNVSLSESDYRDIVRKDLFRGKVRDRLAEDVPRIQEQVHVFRIILADFDESIRNTIAQRLKSGENISDLAKEYSVDSDVARDGGDEGWIPPGVIPQLDTLLFGLDADGARFLPVGQPSNIVRIPGESNFGVLYVAEYSAAREIDPGPLEVLKDAALRDWFEQLRKKLDIDILLNSSFQNWVNRQVRLSSVLPSPTPDPTQGGQFRIDQFGQLVPATPP